MEENKEVKVKKKTNIKKTILLTMGSLGFLALGTCLGYYLAIYTDGHDKIRKNTTVTSNEQSNVVSNTNSNANTIVVKKENDQYVVEDSSKEMTSEKAFKMLKKGIYDKDGIYLVGTEITQKGDNDSYLVISTCYMAQNVDGKMDRAYHGGGSSLFYYKDGKWYFTYPATGYADTPFKEYNLKEYKLASYTELTDKAGNVANDAIDAVSDAGNMVVDKAGHAVDLAAAGAGYVSSAAGTAYQILLEKGATLMQIAEDAVSDIDLADENNWVTARAAVDGAIEKAYAEGILSNDKVDKEVVRIVTSLYLEQ